VFTVAEAIFFKKQHQFNLGNSCYHSVLNLLSSHLLSKNKKIKIYRTIILHVVLYGCETWSLTLREGHRRRVYESLRILYCTVEFLDLCGRK
jgi:hypothetical protein